MSGLGLNSNDYSAITRSLDANKNNRIDPSEAAISYRAQSEIGNRNGIAGTKELAVSLEKGDVFISKISRESADKISEYFSKREINSGKMPDKWISDGWVSKEDLRIEEPLRSNIDTNSDNKISANEFSDALVSGQITIGKVNQGSGSSFANDPFSSKPAYSNTKPVNSDPFSSKPVYNEPRPVNSDPFSSKPVYNDPYSERADSGAGIELKMIDQIYSDSDKAKILNSVASNPNLSVKEQIMVVDYTKKLFSDSSKTDALKRLASNVSLSDPAATQIAKNIDMIFSDSGKTDVLNTLSRNRLSDSSQKWVVYAALNNVFSDSSKTQIICNLANNQYVSNETKQYIVNEMSNKIFSNSNKMQITNALFH